MSEERTHTTAAADAARAASEKFRFDRIQKAKAWCEAHYLSNPSFTDCAAVCGISRFHFHREFHAVAGVTFKAYVDSFRIEKAKRRLLAGRGSTRWRWGCRSATRATSPAGSSTTSA